MYLGKRTIKNPEEYAQNRNGIIETKWGAVWNAFFELEGLLATKPLAQQYFRRSPTWVSRKLKGCTLGDKSAMFKPDEFHALAEAFRHIALRLNAHADEIDEAQM